MDELAALNARILHLMPFGMVCERLPKRVSETDWDAIRGNLKRLSEAEDWGQILHGHVVETAEGRDRDFLGAAAQAAAQIDWQDAPWASLVARLKETTGRAGKPLFQPLRRALTGRDSGPEMAVLLPLIGRDEAISRLRAAASINGIV
jgi:glutamyl-tRNA synthetase